MPFPYSYRRLLLIFSLLVIPAACFTQDALEESLLKVLGAFPAPPPLDLQAIDSVHLSEGWRFKISYTAEPADPLFHRPIDVIKAYLFVPDHKPGARLPAIVAIHQDGPNTHLGKLEPAGLAGDADQHFGLELFQRGYVVICPDRYGHAGRRRIPNAETAGSEMMRDLGLWLKWSGQLILEGRTDYGKEVSDLMRAVDVLIKYDFVDTNRIGAIGHSAGGDMVPYFMFVDKRIKAGVSSCGFFDLVGFYDDQNHGFANSVFALPGLVNVGSCADYLAFIAPRPILLTRGLKEYEHQPADSLHVAETKSLVAYAFNRYASLNAPQNISAIYFNGGHAFPDSVRTEAYRWLDRYLTR